jgi:hypothetical protein
MNSQNLVKLLNKKCHLSISAVDMRLLQTNKEKGGEFKSPSGSKIISSGITHLK